MNSGMASIRQIQCFQAVVELGNFSRAAERLHTSQAGVSHAIRDLETLLDTRLFDRTTRRVELTEAGRVFAAGALAGLAEIERSVDAVRDLGQLRTGLVRIAAPPLIGATVLPRLLRIAKETYPTLRIRIEDVAADAVVTKVRTGLSDLGVGTFAQDEDGIETQRVLRDSLMLFMQPDNQLSTHSEIPWRSLRDIPIIALTRESNIRLLTELGFESAALALRPHLEVHQIHTALALVENGAGVAILPTYAFAGLNGRKILARPLTEPVIARDVSIITARDRAASPATIAIRPLLRSVLRELVPHIEFPADN
ncbi:LysR family transcriptional regulator [Mesorhizobium sp. SB112]|uniref:LysR family transcriptional regulator n=1 Tax=Mesorhizobium sp. SB112 TaxID=3151853 RepID=UPI00326490D4